MTAADDVVTRLHGSYHHVSFAPRDFLPEKLCHYTSAAGLLGILESGVLRASNFAYLNDSSEMRYGEEIVRDVLVAYLDKAQDRDHDVLHVLLKSVEQIASSIEFYLTCFCTEPDLLSQWRGYGTASGRFCIVFDPEQLYNATPTPAHTYFGRVIYQRQEQIGAISKIIDRALDAVSEAAQLDEPEQKACAKGICNTVFEKLIGTMCLFKHRGFHEESEWRAVHWLQDIEAVGFEARYNGIRPFIEMFRGSGSPPTLPVLEIVVGSSGVGAQGRKSVEMLLERRGYRGVRVSDSDVPYRDA